MKFNLCEKVVEAFLQQKPKKQGNVESTGLKFYLFKNLIAEWRWNEIFICDGGCAHTQSTGRYLKEMGATIALKKGQFYKNGIKWNGSWISINEEPVSIEQEERTSLFN